MHTQRRQGYTLIELLVSMALIMTIMAILSEAFVTGLEAFSKLKAIGDMGEQLRTASTVIRDDLNCDHFDARIRPCDFSNGVKPREGFIRIYQGAAATPEGSCDGITSWYATSHVLHLGVKRRGNRQDNFFTASVPNGSPLLTASTTFFNQPSDARYQSSLYTSQWAEVCYNLQPIMIGASQQTASGTPLFALYRTQRLCVADSTAINAANVAPDPGYAQMSLRPPGNAAPLVFNTPADLTTTANRSIDPTNTANIVSNDQLLLSNVISFSVRPIARWVSPNAVGGIGTLNGMPTTNDGLFANLYGNNYDSASAISQGALMGVEITIRVWDLKSRQARQITIVNDL